ncbi:MAG: helix-turn-helix domain-containing protein [Oceanospirillales bacterium]|nr:helix-turn-helix domain-containing protein [Oceanospirillales bacterium]
MERSIETLRKQRPGERNNRGHYSISDWGRIDPKWVDLHADEMRQALALTAEFLSQNSS